MLILKCAALFLFVVLIPVPSVWAQDGPASQYDSVEEEKDDPLKERTPQRERDFSCGGKTKCAQMSSCAEARFYLTACGLRRLDRDNDGVPCESICR